MELPKGLKPEDEARIVELTLGGAPRALCYPAGAVDHFMDTYGESPCHVALYKLRTFETIGGNGADRDQVVVLANPKWVMALLHSGLITSDPTLKRETVRRWVWEAFEGKDGQTLQTVCNALCALVMLGLERWSIANFGLERRFKEAMRRERPTKAAKTSTSRTAKPSAATSDKSENLQSVAG